MAVTAREVILVFRGQNYLSSAIRRVGRDVSTLSRTQALTQQKAQLQVVGQRLNLSRQTAAAELASIQTGARRIAQERAVAEQKVAQLRSDATLLRNQAQLSKASRAVVTGVPLRSFTMAETAQMQKSLEKQVMAATAAIENQQISVQQLAAREAALTEREAQLTQIVNTRTRALDLNTAKLRQNALAMSALPWERFQTGSRYVEHAGRVLQMFGLIAGATFGYFAKSAADFSTQATLAATQATVIGQNSVANVQKIGKQLNDALVQMLASGSTTAKPDELTAAAYKVFSSLSIPGNQQQQIKAGINLIKEFNQVLTANYGMVTFDEVTQAGVMIINNFDKGMKNVNKDLNTLQAGVRFGNVNMSQFIGMLNQAAPAGKAVGYTFDQVASSLAFLSRTLSPRIASAGYARLTETLSKNAAAFRANGIEVNKVGGGLRPINDIIDEMLKKFPKLATGQLSVVEFLKNITGAQSTVQARRALTQYLHDLAGARLITAQVTSDTNELTKSAIAAGTSPGVAWAKFTNQLRGLVLLLGSGAIPAFARLAKPIESLVKWFAQLNPHTQRLIGYIAAFVSVGTLLVGTIAAIGGGIGSLVAGFALWRIGQAAATGGLLALSSEAGFISIGGLLALGIPVAIFLLIRYHKQIGEIINRLGGLKNVLVLVSAALGVALFAKSLAGLNALKLALVADTTEVTVLRSALLSLAGLVVTATVIILERHKIEGAIKTALGDTLSKEIDPFSGKARGVSFGQGVSSFLFTSGSLNDVKKARNTLADYYRQFLQTSKVLGSPTNFKRWEEFLKEFGVTSKTTAKDYVAALYAMQHPSKDFAGVNKIGDFFTKNAKEVKALRAAFSGWGKDLTPAQQKVIVKQQQSLMQQVSNVNRLYQKANTSGSYKDWVNYYTALDGLQKKYKGAQLEALNELLNAQKSAVGSANQINQVSFQDALSGIQSLYNNFLQQEQSAFGTLFQGPFVNSPAMQNFSQWGGMLTGKDLAKDLQSQLTQFTHFHGLLNNLARRGAPYQLLQQLQQLGPGSIKQIKALTSLSKPELDKYFGMFRKSQRDINTQTMKDLNAQLNQYRKYGRNIALAIVAGLRDENVALTKTLTNLVKQIFPGLPVGATGAGGRPTHHKAATTTAGTTEHHTHYHVVAPTEDHASIKTKLRHADFVIKNRYSGRFGPA